MLFQLKMPHIQRVKLGDNSPLNLCQTYIYVSHKKNIYLCSDPIKGLKISVNEPLTEVHLAVMNTD
jgi:hypothetical protein